jgi:competence protein ComEA
VRRRGASLAGRVAGWLDDRLPPALQGRVALGSAHLAVVACLLAAGLAVAAVVVLRSGAAGQPVPVVPGSGGASMPVTGATGTASTTPAGKVSGSPNGSPGGAPSGSPGPAGGAAASTVVVDVAGKVRRPGIASLPAGSRVVDALRRAGGARPGVDLSSLNLARVLVDGEQILVGVAAPPGAAAAAASAPSAGAVPGQLVNLNSATLEQLDTLPGVGPVTAQKIVDWRSQHQQFSSVDELLEIDGIGEKTLADLAPFVTL